MKRSISIFIAAALPILGFCDYFVPEPVFHPNNSLATSGDSRTPFYHDNGQVAYLGALSYEQSVFYKNGEVAWRGGTGASACGSYENCSVQHNNGMVAWKGVSYKDTSAFSSDPCSIYHSNGALAWKGALLKDCYWTTNSCSLYYRNGATAWRGAHKKDTNNSTDACTVRHTNGAPAWRGSFAFEQHNAYYSGVYHNNGQLAWAGKYGDPIYDANGYVVDVAAEAINLPLGDGSWLYISYNGATNVHLNLGNECYLSFSNLDENPRLLMNLGPGLGLVLYPYTNAIPQISVYNVEYPIR